MTYGLTSVVTDCGSGCGLRPCSPSRSFRVLDDPLAESLFPTLLAGSSCDGSEGPNKSTVKESIGSGISESKDGLSLSDVGIKDANPSCTCFFFRFIAASSWPSDDLRLMPLVSL